ncbi:ChrR family anti-sigma-E factor [Pararhodospirillum oryzae]|uniref:Transcriptional regulator n=1 Tax=Pararhodospirillum oryzae TaxID=478448 RepID=A0A512H960_9PROT|nr:ChrR family anti-sigma-E factor [Pararhodospirillum oryzae]GEO81972.1 transcriptional regulator [Pararhodospirillum oryzae]
MNALPSRPVAPVMTHHPDVLALTDYAFGSLRVGPSLVVASHLTFCFNCRDRVDTLEAWGGEALESLPPDPLADDALDRALARLDALPAPVAPPALPAPVASPAPPAPVASPAPRVTGEAAEYPAPVRQFLSPLASGHLPWQPLGPGIRQVVLVKPTSDGSCARLLSIRPRTAFPRHSHRGLEYAIVLAGGFDDEQGRYRLGDVAQADERVSHRPEVGDEPCVCLLATTGPLHFSSPLVRLYASLARL